MKSWLAEGTRSGRKRIVYFHWFYRCVVGQFKSCQLFRILLPSSGNRFINRPTRGHESLFWLYYCFLLVGSRGMVSIESRNICKRLAGKAFFFGKLERHAVCREQFVFPRLRTRSIPSLVTVTQRTEKIEGFVLSTSTSLPRSRSRLPSLVNGYC